MYDTSTYLQLSRAESRARSEAAASTNRAARVARLRRLDRRAQQAATRARLVRLALDVV